MIALFFEVLPRPGHEGTYLDMAAKLRPELDASGGMMFLDRSRSDLRPTWFLSHQFWDSEESMVRWRCNGAHHRAQACGRSDVLADYRLRVAPVIASVTVGSHIAEHAHAARIAAAMPNRFVVSIVGHNGVDGIGGETFSSVYDPSLIVQIVPVVTKSEGLSVLAAAAAHSSLSHARLCLISRDYGMFDRAEAPQYFEPVTLS